MGIIIVCVIIVLVVISIKKKKADKAGGGQRPSVDYAGTTAMPVPHLRGQAVTDADLPKKRDDLISGSDLGLRGSTIVDNPDYLFACTKKLVDSVSRDANNVVVSVKDNSEAYRLIKYGVRLAEFYRDGYGCDPDPRAAVELIQLIRQLWEREYYYISRNSAAFNEEDAECAMELSQCYTYGLLCQADCFAILGSMDLANEVYRHCYSAADTFENSDYVRENVIIHAMGDYSVNYPRPMCYAVATEFALSLAGAGNPMGGHFLMALLEIGKLDFSSLGKSWEQNLSVYSKGSGAYSAYQVGRAKLYGLGTQQDTKEALTLLEAAYNEQSVQAAKLIYEYYSYVSEATHGSGTSRSLCDDWSHRYERIKANPEALLKIKSTGAVNEEMAAFANEYIPTEQEAYANDTADAAMGVSDGASSQDSHAGEFDLKALPSIIYDDTNRMWKRRYAAGDYVIYYNDDGGEIYIRNAHISGSGATTNMGNFHWY